jgi:hypothetical protein
MIKLEDDIGSFWLTDQERMWSDEPNDALHFLCEDTAYRAAELAKARVKLYIDWYPRVKVVKFK